MMMIQIDKKTYKVDDKNFYKSKYDKKQIIIAGSLRKENYHIKRLQKKEYGNTKKWCTFSIDRQGKIFQHYDPKYYSDFIGIKEIDKLSISVVLENMGIIFYDYSSNKYLNWLHEECDEKLVFEKKWNGYTYWEKYTPEQVASTIELCEYLCEEYYIEKDSLGYNVFFDNSNKFEGIITRSNLNQDYTDLNPSFNFKYFLEKLDIEI